MMCTKSPCLTETISPGLAKSSTSSSPVGACATHHQHVASKVGMRIPSRTKANLSQEYLNLDGSCVLVKIPHDTGCSASLPLAISAKLSPPANGCKTAFSFGFL